LTSGSSSSSRGRDRDSGGGRYVGGAPLSTRETQCRRPRVGRNGKDGTVGGDVSAGMVKTAQ
jgi:hypothetical protein